MGGEKSYQRVLLGSFDAEDYLRDQRLSLLPAIKEVASTRIVRAMDELLFPLAQKDDVVINRYKMNQAHKDYLQDIGFSFTSNNNNLEDIDIIDQPLKKQSVFQLLLETHQKSDIQKLMPSDAIISPFAVLPFIKEVCNHYRLKYMGPEIDVVKKVNSKVYSTQLKNKIGLKDSSRIITQSEEMLEVGKHFLLYNQTKFLIKDEYGVSGRGNILIQSEAMFNRIISYVRKQEEKGRLTRFILEPYLDKAYDFSCQFHISNTGKYQFLSIQKVVNRQFAYLGSYSSDQFFLDKLETMGYFNVMKKVAKELYGEGYNGDVCVDSMMLKNGSLVPIIEINARQSMSLIKHNMDRYLIDYGKSNGFSYISFTSTTKESYECFLAAMALKGILFNTKEGKGIIPLSANTMFINRVVSEEMKMVTKAFKGRLYFSLVTSTDQERDVLMEKLRQLLESFECCL